MADIGFPKIRGTLLGVLIIRIIVFWGLYWGPLFLGDYHIGVNFRDPVQEEDSTGRRN